MPAQTSKTIGVAGADYTAFATWVSATTGANNPTGPISLSVLWTSAGSEFQDHLNWGTFDDAGLNRITITAASGQAWFDDAGMATNPRSYDASKGAAIRVPDLGWYGMRFNGPVVTIKNLQIKTKAGSYPDVLFLQNNKNCIVENCILELPDVSRTVIVLDPSLTGNTIIRNNFMISRGSDGIGMTNAGGTQTIDLQNNTIVQTTAAGSTIGLKGTTGFTGTMHNNVVYGFNTDSQWPVSVSGAYNATSKTSAGATGLPTSNIQYGIVGATEWESITDGSSDLRIKSTSTQLKDGGTASFGSATDASGQARSGAATDIGAFEYQSPAASVSDNNIQFILRGVARGVARGVS